MTSTTKDRLQLAAFSFTVLVAIAGWAMAFGGGNATLRADVTKAIEGVQRIEAKRREERVGDRLARIEEKLDAIKQSLQRLENKP